MRELINGHIYDTAQSKRISHIDYGEPLMSAECVYEALYLTPAGRYFLYSIKGIEPGRYAQCIEPVTPERADEWLDINRILFGEYP